MAKIPLKDFGLDSDYITVEEAKKMGWRQNKLPPNSGLASTAPPETVFGYNRPRGSRQIKRHGAYIVLGQVAPTTAAEGFTAQGMLSPTVDIVVGRNASARRGKGPRKQTVVENNFATDAARVYISRVADLDLYFGLAKKPTADADAKKARSGVGVKADKVAIIGREGVKIVTGGMSGAKFGSSGETNSLGGKIVSQAPKIELIAGNNYQGVSGIAKGDATRDSLRELHDIISDILGAVNNFITIQTAWDGVLGVSPFPHYAAGAAPKTMGNLTMVMNSLYSSRLNLMLWQFNTLNPAGNDYIVSRNVNSN